MGDRTRVLSGAHAASPEIEVFTCGEAMALLLAENRQPLARADRFLRSVAGSESNVAIALARLGHRVAFSGRIGLDAPGEWVRAALQAESIDVSDLLTDPQRATGLILRDCPPSRPISVHYYRRYSAGSALTASDVQPRLIATARLVFLSGITPMLSEGAAEYVDRVLDIAEEARVPVVFDPNIRQQLASHQQWRSTLSRYLERIDTLLIGHEELGLLGLADDPVQLLSGRRRTVVVKRGAEGATAYTSAGVIHAPARKVETLDPIGAGDAFCAGWISAYLRGLTVRDSLSEATAVASFVVAAIGDTAGSPSAQERDWALQENGPDVDR
jgi:2-dehydro-3-deoxygluconokinase